MAEDQYTEALDALRDGARDELIIEAAEFPVFFEIWRHYPYQNAIKAIAGRQGRLTYRKKA